MSPITCKDFLHHFPKKIFSAINERWLRSLYWDVFWFHSGLWLTLLIINFNSSIFQSFIYPIGLFLFWIAHRFSSFYLAWGTKAYRPLLNIQRKRFVIIPFSIVIGVFIFLFLIPETLFPFSITERIVGLFFLDFAWGFHHFAAQHYGVLRLYQHHSNPKFSKLTKKMDGFYCWVVGGLMVILAELLHGTSYLQEKQILPLINSIWFLEEEISFFLRIGAFAVLIIMVLIIKNALFYRSGLPKILYLLGIGIMVMAAFQLDPLHFLMLWTLQHWMVSLGLAIHMGGNDIQINIRKSSSIFSENCSLIKSKKTFLLLLSFCIFSVILTPFFELEATLIYVSYSEKIFPVFFSAF